MRRTFQGHAADLSIDTRAFAVATRPADRIILPVQGTDEEFFAQQWAVEFAASTALPIRAIHVAAPGAKTPNDVFLFLRRFAEKWGVQLETAILEGDVVRELLRETDVRDLVIIGTRRLATQYHVGSVAAALIRLVPCPVQVVRIP